MPKSGCSCRKTECYFPFHRKNSGCVFEGFLYDYYANISRTLLTHSVDNGTAIFYFGGFAGFIYQKSGQAAATVADAQHSASATTRYRIHESRTAHSVLARPLVDNPLRRADLRTKPNERHPSARPKSLVAQ